MIRVLNQPTIDIIGTFLLQARFGDHNLAFLRHSYMMTALGKVATAGMAIILWRMKSTVVYPMSPTGE
jgi:hypothetical protein